MEGTEDGAEAIERPRQRSSMQAVLVGSGATVVCALPVYLLGALAVQVTQEFEFGLTQLGIAVALFRATGAVVAGLTGYLADRLGATRSLRIAIVLAALSSIGVSGLANTYVSLVAWLMLGAIGKSLCQPAANRLLVNNVREGRRGIAFGVKQSAAPASTMIGGLSVPLIALTVGWRWAYVMVAVLSVIVLIAIGRRPSSSGGAARKARPAAGRLRDPRTIVTLALAFGLGTAASSTVPTFYVDAAVRAGTTEQIAGTLLAAASIAAMITRIVTGFAADRIVRGHTLLCAGLLAFGALGLLALAADAPGLMTVGAIVALAGTWGFNAVFWFTLMQAYPDAPGKVTGAVSPGGLAGGVVGPILMGALAERFGYPAGWMFAAVSATLAAVGMVYGAKRLERLAVADAAARPEETN